MAVPINHVDQIEDIINDGLLFDGSSVDGFADISDSDLILKPELSTYSYLPWRPQDKGTARFICDVYHTDGKTPYEGDPRYVLRKSVEKVEKLGYKYNVGPEPEFFIIDKAFIPNVKFLLNFVHCINSTNISIVLYVFNLYSLL